MKKPVKKDSDKTIISCQRIEIDKLMSSERALKEEIETLNREVKHYKDNYNNAVTRRNKADRQIWRMSVIEDLMLEHIFKLEDAYKVPLEFRMKIDGKN